MAAVDAAKAKLTALGEEYKARMDAHEVLSETGRDRYRYAADVLGTLVKDTATGKAASSERLLSSVHDSNDFLTPQAWAKKAGEWRNNVANGLSDAPSPELAALLKTTNKVSDLMDHYIANGSTDEKALAKIIKKFNLTTTVDVGAMPSGFRPNSVGGFDSVGNRIRLLDSGVTAHTLFHEVLHAVSNDALERAEAISTPKNQTEAKIKQAYAEFDGVRREALQQGNAKEHYGLTDAHEFLSELNTNAGFREFLSGIKSGKTTLWDRAVDAIRKMLGMDPKATTLLDKAMKTQDAFFNKEAHDEAQRLIREKQEFDESPAGAAKVTDSTLRSLVKSADKHEDDVLRGVPSAIERGIASALHTGHQAKLSIQTTQFIAKILGYAAERMPTLKPLVGHVEAFRGAWDQGKLVSHMLATYGDNATIPLDRQLKALSSAKAKEVNFTMGRLGTNSSIGGYYPHLNYADNLKRLPDLDPKLARHINAEYEIFKQLNRDYPAAANALLEGSKVYLNQYQHTTAATTFNLLKLAEGRAERAAEAMVGMAADDPGLPALAARVDGASAEMALVAQAAGIDIGSNEVRHGALVDGKWQGHRNGDTTKFLDGTSFVLGKRLDAIFKQAETLPEGSVLRDQLKAIGDTYAAQTTTPYYPAGRIGEHFASIGWKDMDDATWAKMGKAMEGSGKVLGDYQGQDHAMMTFNTASEAAGMRNRLEAAMGDKADISKSLSGLRAAYIGNDLAGLSTGLRAVLDTLHDNITSLGLAPEQALAMKDQLTRTILSLTPETSGKSAKIARQGIPGADGDYLGVMARTSMASAHDTAGIYAAPLFAQASRGMDAALRTLALDPDIKVQEYGRSVVTEMLKRHENSMKPASTSLAPLINAIGYAWTMAVNLGQVIRNGSGIAIQSLPRLGGTYGYVPAFKALMSTGADAMRIVTGELHRNFAEGGVAGVLNARIDFHKLGLTDRLAHDMQFLQDHGVFDQGQGAVLRDMAQGGSTKMNELHRAVSSFVTYSELYNRLVVGMAASNLAHARQPGMPGDAISAKHQAYAREVIDETLGNFNPTNIGRALGRHGFASEWTPIMTMFTQFNFQAMEQIAAATHAGLFGKDKSEAGLARAKAARKELAGVFGMTTMVAGVMGLPFATAVAGLYNKFNDDPDNPGDIREVVRSALASHFGVGGGDLVAHGLIGGIGMDSSGFGMANLIPGSELLASRRQGKDFLDDASKALIGPAFGMILDGARAWSEFKDGNVVQAITHMMPAAVKGPWKASVMAERGFTDSKGNPIGLTATPSDIAIQWLGFRPESLAMQRELSGYTQTDQNILNHRSGVLTDHIFKAHKFGDAADQEKAMVEWKAFILKNPTQPIADLAAVFRKHAMDEAIGRMTGTGVAVSKRQLPTFMRDSQWANQGGMPAY